VPLTAQPIVPFDEARAMCTPRARAAGSEARAATGAELANEQIVGGYSRAVAPERAYRQARDETYVSCLAEQGWSLRAHPQEHH
jgi:hypothetical protein